MNVMMIYECMMFKKNVCMNSWSFRHEKFGHFD